MNHHVQVLITGGTVTGNLTVNGTLTATLAVSETYSTKKTVEENLATSKSYADGVGSKTLESAKSDATSKANQAKSDAIADTDKKLTSYSTTEQMNSATSIVTTS